jgi:hypothetical protein
MRARHGAVRARLALRCSSTLFAEGRGAHFCKHTSLAALVEKAVPLSALRRGAGYKLGTSLGAAVRTQGAPARPACSEVSLMHITTLMHIITNHVGSRAPQSRKASAPRAAPCVSLEGGGRRRGQRVGRAGPAAPRGALGGARTALVPARACTILTQYQVSDLPAQVPWGGRQLTVGLLAWASTFVAVGLLVMPLLARAVGVQVRALARPPQAEAAPRC